MSTSGGRPQGGLRTLMQPIPRMPIRSREYWDALRGSFEKRYREKRDSWTVDGTAALAGWELLCRLEPGVQHTVLDIGTGRGRDLELFLEKGHRCTGIDIVAPDNWPALREKYGDAIELQQTSLLDYPRTREFDAILDNGCFHHQHPDEIPAYLRSVEQLLAPGGIALFVVYTPDDVGQRGALMLDADGRLHRELTLREMRAHLAAADLEVTDARRVQRGWRGKLLFVACTRIDDVTRPTD